VSAAVAAAAGAARRRGVPVRDPAVLRESSSVIVLLAPGGPVARVAGLTAAVRDGLAAVSAEIDAFHAPVQPLHGDASLGNALPGPLWNDWEDACIGPVEWDLACLVTSARVTGERRAVAEAALAAYGAALPELFVRARGLQVVAWSGFAAAAGDARARLRARLAWLRSQLG